VKTTDGRVVLYNVANSVVYYQIYVTNVLFVFFKLLSFFKF